MHKRYAEGLHNVRFLLHHQGLIITHSDKRLITKKMVQDNSQIQVLWADETNNNYQDSKFFVWTLRKCKSIKHAYYIE